MTFKLPHYKSLYRSKVTTALLVLLACFFIYVATPTTFTSSSQSKNPTSNANTSAVEDFLNSWKETLPIAQECPACSVCSECNPTSRMFRNDGTPPMPPTDKWVYPYYHMQPIYAPGHTVSNPSTRWNKLTPIIPSENMEECKRLISETFPKSQYGSPCWTYDGGIIEDSLLALHPRCSHLWLYTPSLQQFTNLNSGGRGILGFDSTGILFSTADYVVLNFALVANPTFKTLVEFGTAGGVTSLFLGVVAKSRNGTFVTFDYTGSDCRVGGVKDAWIEGVMVMMNDDILATLEECPNRSEGERTLQCHPCSYNATVAVSKADFLLIDNGDKLREASLYAPYLPLNSVIAVHDHYGEVNDYSNLFGKVGYDPVYHMFATAMGSHLRVWKRTREGVIGLRRVEDDGARGAGRKCFAHGYM
ncbi:hypothetical protein HK097_002549 [Rhizophlyctis rosea]|uniref:Methyltransferase n=1 Tax=Rhizophlyctis rosea TaxID=64517 RepID=A0AAD5SAV9_9FUNG|nr:hypothetical protein HK097_002549 [Rhizophlyctis rosea]